MPNRKPFAVIDAETDPFKLGRTDIKPFIWGYYNGSDYHDFTSTNDLVNFLSNKKETIYAHNGGKFDFHFLLDYIQPSNELLIINGRLAKFNIGNCDFRDSYCILPIPLRDFKKDSFEYWKMERGTRQKYMPEIKGYLKSDCVNLWNMINEFIERFGKNITLASSAFKLCNKMTKLKKVQTSKKFHDNLVPYYFGGRCETFYKGIIKKKFRSIDINSAYPYAMTFQHPIGAEYYERQIKVKPVNEFHRKLSARMVSREICDSLLSKISPQNFYKFNATTKACLPYKDMSGGLTFPSDKRIRTYFCTGWELQTALETASIVITSDIKETVFPKTTNFPDYVYRFYDEKNSSQKGSPEYIFAKLFLNAAYGKYGANPDNYYQYKIIPIQLISEYTDPQGYIKQNFDETWIFERELKTTAIIKRKLFDEEKRFFNVATAASITGFVRAYLFKTIAGLGNSGAKVLYCDTDSITFAGKIGKISLGNGLGQWDEEKESPYRLGGIAGKKLYAYQSHNGGWKTASKGVKLSHYDIMRLAKDPSEVIDYTFEAPVFSLKKEPFIQTRSIRQT